MNMTPWVLSMCALAAGVFSWLSEKLGSTRFERPGLVEVQGVLRRFGIGFALVMWIAIPVLVPPFERSTRSKTSRVWTDLRSLSTAIEAYREDNLSYPAWAVGPESAGGMAEVPTPKLRGGYAANVLTLTTPIAYITSYFPDPYARKRGRTFAYYSDSDGWILWSAGPDLDYDLTAKNISVLYDGRVPQPSALLLDYAYDPTNGAASSGDLFRVCERGNQTSRTGQSSSR